MLDDDGKFARDKCLAGPSTCTDVFVISGAIAIEMIHGEAAKWPDELITTSVVDEAPRSSVWIMGFRTQSAAPPICLD